jgi:hypothetical protein
MFKKKAMPAIKQKGAKSTGVKAKLKAAMPSTKVTEAILGKTAKKAKAIGATFK